MTRKTSPKIDAPDQGNGAQSPATAPTVPPTGCVRTPMQAARSAESKVKTGPAPKRDQLMGMLSARNGAALAAISARFGWLPHTTRAALSRLRKSGYQIHTEKRPDGKPTCYRIMAKAGAAVPVNSAPPSTKPTATEMAPAQGPAATPPARTGRMAAEAGGAGDPMPGDA